MRSRLPIVSVLLLAAVLLAGCQRGKKPATAAAPTPETAPVATAPAAPPAAPAAAPAAPDPLAGDLDSVNEYLRRQGFLADIFFDYDRAELRSDAREQLSRTASFLKQHPQFRVTLEGHCDERGTEEYNLALGERRGHTVRQYLTALGVEGERLKTLSYGEERPVCTDSAEECWQQNRRAHPAVTGRAR